MAAVGLLALLDDIASILDDVSILAKVAAKKTAGVLGDDLALNTQQVSGVAADRELPVVFSVFKGSLVNKAILVPAAIVIGGFMPQFVMPLLMVGGAYLCFEGAEKVIHRFFSRHDKVHEEEKPVLTPENAAAEEKRKIRGAVRTDFILSAEIIVIALGTVPENASLALRATVLSLVGFGMTVGVYGLVAGIVKLDDAGLYCIRKRPLGRLGEVFGSFLLGLSPRLMRLLSVAGTVAMFMVGGGILTHGLPWMHLAVAAAAALPLPVLWNILLNLAVGIVAGCLLLVLAKPLSALLRRIKSR